MALQSKGTINYCKCGCGTVIRYKDNCYRRVYYVNGHQRLGKKHSLKVKSLISRIAKRKGFQPPPRTGIKDTPEQLARRRAVALAMGIKPPITSGEKHWHWRGGITSKNGKIRASGKYKKWRTKVFRRDDYTCQICHQRGGKLNADHIKPFAFYPKLRFVVSNGRTLCEKCHKKTPSYRAKVDVTITVDK